MPKRYFCEDPMTAAYLMYAYDIRFAKITNNEQYAFTTLINHCTPVVRRIQNIPDKFYLHKDSMKNLWAIPAGKRDALIKLNLWPKMERNESTWAAPEEEIVEEKIMEGVNYG